MCLSKVRTGQRNPGKNPGRTKANIAKVEATPQKETKQVSAMPVESQLETEPFQTLQFQK